VLAALKPILKNAKQKENKQSTTKRIQENLGKEDTLRNLAVAL